MKMFKSEKKLCVDSEAANVHFLKYLMGAKVPKTIPTLSKNL